MSKIMSNSPGYGLEPHTAPGNFELDEIQWNETDHPIHPDLIPFESRTKQLKKELAELFNKDNRKL